MNFERSIAISDTMKGMSCFLPERQLYKGASFPTLCPTGRQRDVLDARRRWKHTDLDANCQFQLPRFTSSFTSFRKSTGSTSSRKGSSNIERSISVSRLEFSLIKMSYRGQFSSKLAYSAITNDHGPKAELQPTTRSFGSKDYR